MTAPVIGMIVPPAAGAVPPEAYGLYPEGVRFAARGLGLQALTMEDYAIAIKRVAELARELREHERIDAISLMGTSLSFFRGGAFNDDLVALMAQEAGVPATTMSNSIRDALRAVGARRIAVGTAYSDAVNDRLRGFLEMSGFELGAMIGLGLERIEDILAVSEDQVTDLALRARDAADDRVDAIFVSCGGLPALHLAGAVEPEAGIPVIASSTAGVWGAMRLAGLSGETPMLGRLGGTPHLTEYAVG
ncbi:aspartate/glutamate racemase family protein [Aestuariivita sp.]|uniref:arylmalonate decarboxylase n=1 Tax=Aestuariivita sp. TaxID=1872407 RepID=UPI00216DB6E3|nr:aspartate/glutamate racemase family protein [Aestuariivita sp.]MCE8005627.1 arylmalonate decarboxylase [Aestuariivita sp.]